MKKLLNSIILMFFLVVGFSQPEDAVVEVINGKKYYVHIVEQGNTLYGIHTLYNTDVEAILNANEGLTNELTIGQRILIPIDEGTNSSNNTVHVVTAGETLYGISKKYNCTVDQLKKLNPGIEDGIKPGQEIKVPGKSGNVEVVQDDPEEAMPQYEISYNDSIIVHTVLAHETMYSISKRYMVSMDTIRAVNGMKNNKVKEGDVLKIPVKKVSYEIIEKDLNNLVPRDSFPIMNDNVVKKDVYNVALMLPFMLYKNDQEMSKTLMIDQVRELYPTTKIAFQFYQGFMMAADSLAKAGLSVNIFVYDTNRDTATVAKIFAKKEFNSMDLVVGPLYSNVIKYAAKECQKRKIRIVLPFKADTEVLHNNPYVYKAVASNMTLMDGAVDYIIKRHAHHKIFIFKPTGTSDLAIYERVRERYNTLIAKVPGAYTPKIIEVSLGSKSARDLDSYIATDTTNVFIIPSENVKYVSGAMLRLNALINMNYRSKNMKIIAFGIEDWNQFEDLDMLHRMSLHQHYATYRYVDYNQGRGLEFVKAFRQKFGTDPTVYSSQGFDVGMYFMGALHLFGTNFDNQLSQFQIELVQNEFEFLQIAQNAGRENARVCIIKYEDYRLKKMD